MGGVNPLLILGLAIVAILYLKGFSRSTLTAQLKPRQVSGLNTEKQSSTSIDAYSVDELGMAYARAKKREAEDEVSRAIVDRAGKTIKDAFTAPFSAADPKNAQDEHPF